MKKVITLFLSLVLLLGLFALPASAAYVTDGDKIYLAGDANDDGNIDVLDLVKAANGSAGAEADLDGDGAVGAYDQALIRAIILEIDRSEWTE